MFVLLRCLIPLCTPVTAETTKQRVSTAMIEIARPVDVSTSQTKFSPLLICNAPSPSDVALPKRVAKMAKESIALPIGPFTRSPRIG
jgi:hypothetical protein